MPNKRIRKKWAKKYGYCPKCCSLDTASMRGWGLQGGCFRPTGYAFLRCFRCNPLTEKERAEHKELADRVFGPEGENW